MKRKKPDGSAALSLKTQRGQLTTVQQLFKWLTRQKYILSNPASELELPRVKKRLPRVILTASQVEQVMNVPDLTCRSDFATAQSWRCCTRPAFAAPN